MIYWHTDDTDGTDFRGLDLLRKGFLDFFIGFTENRTDGKKIKLKFVGIIYIFG